jgi:hypothetical protein
MLSYELKQLKKLLAASYELRENIREEVASIKGIAGKKCCWLLVAGRWFKSREDSSKPQASSSMEQSDIKR